MPFHYFGYGSNLSEPSLRAKGVNPIASERGILRDWRLSFDLPHFFRIEGGTGNIRPESGAEVHGIVYTCNDADLATLDRLEAVDVAYVRKHLTIETYDGVELSACTYVGEGEGRDADLRPSRRYLNILLRGAETAGLRPDYVEALRRVEVRCHATRGPFVFPRVPDRLFSTDELAGKPHLTALAGAVFDLSSARPEHRYLQSLFAGRDMTVFFLQRLDSSDGTETQADVERGTFTEYQRTYLDDYLHEFCREYVYVGRMDYAARRPSCQDVEG